MTVKVAVAQMRVAKEPDANLEAIGRFAEQAAAGGARLLVLPEGLISRDAQDPNATQTGAQAVDGPFVRGLEEISRKHGVALAGTVHLKEDTDAVKVLNSFLVIDDGQVVERYDKLHLYDAFADKESDKVIAGNDLPPVVELDGVRFGLATCYDLRFPEHSRHLALAGAQVILVPAAWVRGPMKEHHWMTLCTARALDNTVYVVGSGEVSQRNVGMSCVVDPMGRVVSAAAEDEALIFADIDTQRVDDVRAKLPVLANMRFAHPSLSA